MNLSGFAYAVVQLHIPLLMALNAELNVVPKVVTVTPTIIGTPAARVAVLPCITTRLPNTKHLEKNCMYFAYPLNYELPPELYAEFK